MGTKATSGGGDFYRPPNGMYIGKLERVEETIGTKYNEETTEAKWVFNVALFNYPGREPFIVDGEQAIARKEEKQSLHVRANAREWFSGFLGRRIEDGEDSDDLIPAATGNYALCQYGPSKQKGTNGTLLNVIAEPGD